MKKILALALAAAMSLTLVACGGSKTPAASGSASSGGSSSAETVDFPGNKQVSLIVPYSAGGASDTVARIYASELSSPWAPASWSPTSPVLPAPSAWSRCATPTPTATPSPTCPWSPPC